MLEIDIDYYKQEILQPWTRIFMHLEEFNLEKLFEAFEVKDAERKSIRYLFYYSKKIDQQLERLCRKRFTRLLNKRYEIKIKKIQSINHRNNLPKLSKQPVFFLKWPNSNSLQVLSCWQHQTNDLYFIKQNLNVDQTKVSSLL